MERKEIIVPKGIRYIGEWKEFNLDIDDKPYILNKVLTGCGFTEYCLTNPEDIILVSPRRFLLENKEEQHSKEVYYFRNDNETSTDFELDVNKDDIKAIHEKAEDISEERKVVENLDNLKRNLRKAYLDAKSKNKPFKILVTYDSFRHVKDALLDIKYDGRGDYELNTSRDPNDKTVFKDFHIVVDEFQSIFIDARFKSEAEITLLNELSGIQKVCFVSATPYLDKYLEMLDEFRDLPYYELDWKTEDQGRVKKPKIDIKFTRSLNEEAKYVIDSYTKEKYESRIDSKTGKFIDSKEAVLFFNSVAGICQVIRTNKLHIDQVNVLCAKTTSNERKIRAVFNEVLKKEHKDERIIPKVPKDYEVIGKIPIKGQPHKMFTLCTRTVYLGADFYSTNARTFVFSDANIDCLSVDISIDLEQILGRQRLKENPWKDSAMVFIKTLQKGNITTKEEFDSKLKEKKGKSDDLLEVYSGTKPELRKSLAEKYQRDAKVSHYKYDYVSVSVKKEYWTDDEGNTHSKIVDMTPVFNNLMMISDMRAFEVQQIDYKDRFTVFSAVDQSSIEGATVKSCELAEEFNNMGDSFLKLKFLVKIGEDETLKEEDINAFLELIPGKYKDYYTIVGTEIIKSCSCKEAEIKKEWRKIKSNGEIEEKVVAKIYKTFEVGKRYTNKDIKNKLKELYQEEGYQKTPKTTDLDLLFVMKPILTPDKKHGLEILGKR